MFDNGVFESDTIRANEVRINNEVIFSFWVAECHFGIPDTVGVAGFVIHTDGNGCDNNDDDGDDAENSKKLFHLTPFSPCFYCAWRDIFHLLL